MKRNKILPLILIAPILAGCGGNGTKSVSNVQFEAYSNKVDFTSFVSGLEKADRFYNKGETFNSYSASYSNEESNNKTIKRDNKEVSSSYTYFSTKETGGYDKTNNTLNTLTEYNIESTTKTASEETKREYIVQNNTVYQNTKVDGCDYLTEVSVAEKTYRLYGLVEADWSIEVTAKALVKGSETKTEMENSYEKYEDFTQEVKDYYTFYQDNNLFTVVYSAVYDDNYKVKELEVAAHYVVSETWQIKFNEDSIKSSHKYSYERTINFDKNIEFEEIDFFNGDVYVTKTEIAEVSDYKSEDYTLTPIDLTYYKEYKLA